MIQILLSWKGIIKLKIRGDFVTNSSSSSFILGFRNVKEMAEALMNDNCQGYAERIYDDCMNAKKMTKAEMFNSVMPEIREQVGFWAELDEAGKENKDWTSIENNIRKRMDEVEEKMNSKIKEGKYKVFVSVDYDDDTDPDLECYVVPNLEHCVLHLSYH